MSEKKRLGIYGGTFSPPHLGHLRAAKAFAAQAKLDELLIMPTFLPPHKDAAGDVSPDSRLEMCRLAFCGLEKTSVSDFEILKGGKSYTYLTLEEFSGEDRELFFLVGTDMFLTLDKWRNPEIIFSLAKIAFIRRENDNALNEEIEAKREEYKAKYGAEILSIDTDVTEISSTDIRNMILSGEDTSVVLDVRVRNYIDKKLLYRFDSTEKGLADLRERLKAYLSPSRYSHTLGVERAAVKIAEYCLPEMKLSAAVAALLHDVAKELPEEELLEILKGDSSITKEDLSSPKLYHAFAAPFIIKRDFPEFAAEDILSAVFNHTTGKADMTLFDEIIFAADYIEEGRAYPECIKAREELYSKLDEKSEKRSIEALHECALAELINTEKHISARGGVLNSRTLSAKEYIENKINKSR